MEALKKYRNSTEIKVSAATTPTNMAAINSITLMNRSIALGRLASRDDPCGCSKADSGVMGSAWCGCASWCRRRRPGSAGRPQVSGGLRVNSLQCQHALGWQPAGRLTARPDLGLAVKIRPD